MKKIIKLINNSDRTIINYCDENGFPISKMMLKPRKQVGLKEFWFSTNTSSNKVKLYKENPKASIYFFDKDNYQGVNLIGTMEIIDDKKYKEEIWNDGDELYYKKGVLDPDYTVLKFTANSGRYYGDIGSKNFDIN